jgi:hypothetical protein
MRTLAIRELTGPALRSAADADEVIGITNDRILAGVLIPISPEWIEQLVEQNLTQVVRNIRGGEREMAKATDPPPQPTAPGGFTTLGDVLNDSSGSTPKRMRRVNLRDISGRVLQDAAEQNEAIILTTDRIVAGLIYPITQNWVADLVEQNLARVLHNLAIGEKELGAGHPMTTLDDIAP